MKTVNQNGYRGLEIITDLFTLLPVLVSVSFLLWFYYEKELSSNLAVANVINIELNSRKTKWVARFMLLDLFHVENEKR